MKIIILFVCLAVGGIVATMSTRQKRSIGGRAIPIERAPYFVLIERYNRTSAQFVRVCGGAFIDTRYVLTAAHCVVNEKLKIYPGTVVVSSTGRSDRSGFGHQILGVARRRAFTGIHGDMAHNIAVVKLKTPVEWNDQRRPIPLPTAKPVRNRAAVLIAFETMLDPGETTVLTKLKVKMVSTPDHMLSHLSNKMFTGVVGDDQSMDSADSGAPLVQDGIVIGITSSVVPHTDKYHIFTDVFENLHFINRAMAEPSV